MINSNSNYLEKLQLEANEIINYIYYVNNINKKDYKKVNLNNVDLIAIDTLQPFEALKSLMICEHFFDFGNITLFTNLNLNNFFDDKINFHFIEPISRDDYSNFCLNLKDFIDNDFVLICQHDSMICNPLLWDNSFLSYDYIGAPFNSYVKKLAEKECKIKIENCVGNGGFSLRSRKFLDFTKLIANFPKIRNDEDFVFTFQYYELSQKLTIKFAPISVAKIFSYETDESFSQWILNENFDPTKQFAFHCKANKNKFLFFCDNNIGFKDSEIQLDFLKYTDLTECKDLNDAALSFEPISFKFDYNSDSFLNLQQSQIRNFEIIDQKFYLENLNFVIVTKIDNEYRLKNLRTVVQHLNNFFENPIIIGEYDDSSKINFIGNYKKHLIKPIDKGFHRNYASNELYKKIESKKILFNLESDVIFDPKGIIDCYNTMLKYNLKFGMPFNGRAIWLNENFSDDFINKGKIPSLWKNRFNLEKSLDSWFEDNGLSNYLQIKHPGFAYMVDFEMFEKLGLENLKFKSHGFDDVERIVRFLKFGNGIYWSEFCCYHLWHPRDEKNSWYVSQNDNFQTYLQTLKMNKKELVKEINSWNFYTKNKIYTL